MWMMPDAVTTTTPPTSLGHATRYCESLGRPVTDVIRGYVPPAEVSIVRISRRNVSLTLLYRPAQVFIGAKRSAIVGEWKPGRKRKSLMFLISGLTSDSASTKDGAYGASLLG